VLSHARIWAAIDRLAATHGLTASALARRAGLDPTTFNRSKRTANDGRPRWPSTESIAKILAATQTDVGQFLAADDRRRHLSTSSRDGIPVLGLAQAGIGGYFDDGGSPVGYGWERISFPGHGENVFAIEVIGDSMMPLYRDGDTIIVARDAPCRRGDRVVIKTQDGGLTAKILERKTTRLIEVVSLNPDRPARRLAVDDVEWMARIVWASQ
jgi:phage repressor protein C with HTH and peptisase S24 domain